MFVEAHSGTLLATTVLAAVLSDPSYFTYRLITRRRFYWDLVCTTINAS